MIEREFKAYDVPEQLILAIRANYQNPYVRSLVDKWFKSDDVNRLNIQEDLAVVFRCL